MANEDKLYAATLITNLCRNPGGERQVYTCAPNLEDAQRLFESMLAKEPYAGIGDDCVVGLEEVQVPGFRIKLEKLV
jgi:hypothetical protein